MGLLQAFGPEIFRLSWIFSFGMHVNPGPQVAAILGRHFIDSLWPWVDFNLDQESWRLVNGYSYYIKLAFLKSYMQTDTTVSNFAQQLPTTRNDRKQGVQTEATCHIQHCYIAGNFSQQLALSLVTSKSHDIEPWNCSPPKSLSGKHCKVRV